MAQVSDNERKLRRWNSVMAAIAADIIVAFFMLNVLAGWATASYMHRVGTQYLFGMLGLLVLAVIPWVIVARIFRSTPPPRPKGGKPNNWLQP